MSTLPDYSLLFTDTGQNVLEPQYRTVDGWRFLAAEVAKITGRPVALCKNHPLPCNILESFPGGETERNVTLD
jgi:hypothetical protein